MSVAATPTRAHRFARVVIVMLLLVHEKRRKLGGIGEQTPDRLARRHDVSSQCCIAVLQQREDLHYKKVVRLPEFREVGSTLPLVKRSELVQQIIDLILEGEFGEDSDRRRLPEPLLE